MTAVTSVAYLNARKDVSELIAGVAGDEVWVSDELGGGALPDAPRLGSSRPNVAVVAGQALVVRGNEVATLLRRDRLQVALPSVGVDEAGALLVEPGAQSIRQTHWCFTQRQRTQTEQNRKTMYRYLRAQASKHTQALRHTQRDKTAAIPAYTTHGTARSNMPPRRSGPTSESPSSAAGRCPGGRAR